MIKKLLIALIVCLAFFGHQGLYALAPDAIIGKWASSADIADEEYKVFEIYRCGDKYCGKWLKYIDVTNETDTKNDDDALRNRPIIGLEFLTDLTFEEDEWVDGKAYHWEDGSTFMVKAWFEEEDIKTLDIMQMKLRIPYTPIGGSGPCYRVK